MRYNKENQLQIMASDSQKDKIGKNIKRYRFALTLTQDELASKVGMNTNYLAKVERGEVIPSIEMLKKIAKILRVKVSDLINF